MFGRWLVALLGLMAALSPGQVAMALPDLPPPPPPRTPPPPPTGLRPALGPDGRLLTDAQGRPQFVIDLPQPPMSPARPDNVPQVLMRHLAPLPGTGAAGAPPPVALPVPAAGQGLRDVTTERVVVPPPPVAPPPSGGQGASTLPPPPATPGGNVPPPPPSEGGRRPGGPRGL